LRLAGGCEPDKADGEQQPFEAHKPLMKAGIDHTNRGRLEGKWHLFPIEN